MYGLLSMNRWKGFTPLLLVPLICFACGDLDSPGTEDSGSLFDIEGIDPTYFDDSTRQVDVFRSDCAGPDEDPDPEPYTDHLADVTFTNRPLPNSEEQTSSTIHLDSFQVWYEAVTQGSPPLNSFAVTDINDGNGIQPCDPGADCQGETISQIEFVPVRLKDVLAQYITDSGIFQLEYNIRYRFFGHNDFGYDVSADGATFFYASNYDNCGN
jgi:hypothetical protein